MVVPRISRLTIIDPPFGKTMTSVRVRVNKQLNQDQNKIKNNCRNPNYKTLKSMLVPLVMVPGPKILSFIKQIHTKVNLFVDHWNVVMLKTIIKKTDIIKNCKKK